jgi:hypothetical protein
MQHYVRSICFQCWNSPQWASRSDGRDAQRLAHVASLYTSGGGHAGRRRSRHHCATAGGVLGQAARGQLRTHAKGRGGNNSTLLYAQLQPLQFMVRLLQNEAGKYFVNEELVICTLHQIKENEMGAACSTNGKDKIFMQNFNRKTWDTLACIKCRPVLHK